MVSTDFKIKVNYHCCYFAFSNQVQESRVLVTTDVGSTTSAISSKRISEINENTINGCCAITSKYG